MSRASWEKNLKFRCTGCGNCCRDTVVCVTDADVRRVREGTGLEMDEFVRWVDEDGIQTAKRDPLWVKIGEGRRMMALKWVRGRRRCMFLDDDDMCRIYEHRPGRTISEADNTWFTLLTMNQHPLHFDHE